MNYRIRWSEIQREKKRNKIKEQAFSVILITLAILFVIVVGVSVGIR